MGFLRKTGAAPIVAPQPAPLVDLVAQAAESLRDQEYANRYAAEQFLEQSANAKRAEQEHAKQAIATESALKLLEEAGVEL